MYTLYKFQIELSDIGRGIYETLEFRAAQHPSEHTPYLLTRVLAYILNIQDDLAFSATGLHDPDASAISIPDPRGGNKLVIEVGSPSAKKLHKATKTSQEVKVYTYKNPESLMRDLRDEKVHRAEEIEFYSLTSSFLDELSEVLKKDNRWALLVNEGTLSIQAGDRTISGELSTHLL